jgi:hypothetical protein
MPDGRHETRDLPIRPIVIFAAVLAAAILAVAGISRLLYNGLASHSEKAAGEASPLARPALPPAPRLQTNPPADLATFRAKEDRELSTYGWIDRSNGVVRIPIERAKALVLERGLPARPLPKEIP